MGKGPCFKCGGPHFVAECEEVVFAEELGTASDGRPPWCGECDKRTRLTGDPPGRCARCNPNDDLLAQYRLCRCGQTIRRWDPSPCGSHEPVGEPLAASPPAGRQGK